MLCYTFGMHSNTLLLQVICLLYLVKEQQWQAKMHCTHLHAHKTWD